MSSVSHSRDHQRPHTMKTWVGRGGEDSYKRNVGGGGGGGGGDIMLYAIIRLMVLSVSKGHVSECHERHIILT